MKKQGTKIVVVGRGPGGRDHGVYASALGAGLGARAHRPQRKEGPRRGAGPGARHPALPAGGDQGRHLCRLRERGHRHPHRRREPEAGRDAHGPDPQEHRGLPLHRAAGGQIRLPRDPAGRNQPLRRAHLRHLEDFGPALQPGHRLGHGAGHLAPALPALRAHGRGRAQRAHLRPGRATGTRSCPPGA